MSEKKEGIEIEEFRGTFSNLKSLWASIAEVLDDADIVECSMTIQKIVKNKGVKKEDKSHE